MLMLLSVLADRAEMDAGDADAALVRRLRDGDGTVLADMIDAYYRLCCYCANNLLRSREDAEEAVSDAFYSLWTSRSTFDPGRGTLKAWLLLFVRRRSVDILRRRRGETLPLEEDCLLPVGADEYRMADVRLTVLDIVGGLPEVEREVFYRRFLFSESHGEIARRIGKSAEAVKSIVYKLRKTIREATDYSEGGMLG